MKKEEKKKEPSSFEGRLRPPIFFPSFERRLRFHHLYPPPPKGRGRIKEGEGIPFIKSNAVKLYN